MSENIHGSNMILFADGKALGHCSSCEIQDQSETKSRSIKTLPVYDGDDELDEDLKASEGEDTSKDGLWDTKTVSKRSVSISAEMFVCKNETGATYDELLAKMDAGEPVKVKYAHKGEENSQYRVGLFIITSLTQSAPSDDDVTCSISLENTGKVRVKKVAQA
ncbi:MAG: phage tail tube protein [Candidatus Cryptobacteroides sp.]